MDFFSKDGTVKDTSNGEKTIKVYFKFHNTPEAAQSYVIKFQTQAFLFLKDI